MSSVELTETLGPTESRTFTVLDDDIRIFRSRDHGITVMIDQRGEHGVANPDLERWVDEIADGVRLKQVWAGHWQVADEDALTWVLGRLRSRKAWCYQSSWGSDDKETARRLYAAFAAHPLRYRYDLTWAHGTRFRIERQWVPTRMEAVAHRTPGWQGRQQPIEVFERLVTEQGDEVRRNVIAPDRETPISFDADHPLLVELGPRMLDEVDEPLREFEVVLRALGD